MSAEHYVQAVLAAYLEQRDTPSQARPTDRQLARRLYDQGVPADQVRAAILVAAGRRLDRPPEAIKLGRVQSLAYFMPVIRELDGFENVTEYLSYLENSELAEMSRKAAGNYTE